MPFVGTSLGLHFLHGNTRAHYTRATLYFLQKNDIRLCRGLLIQIRCNEAHPKLTTAAELDVSFLRAWAHIPIAFINCLIHSMYRCAAVIECAFLFSLQYRNNWGKYFCKYLHFPKCYVSIHYVVLMLPTFYRYFMLP